MTAVKTALRRAIPGDLVVCCVDDAVGVYRAAMAAAGTSVAGRPSRTRASWRLPRAEVVIARSEMQRRRCRAGTGR